MTRKICLVAFAIFLAGSAFCGGSKDNASPEKKASSGAEPAWLRSPALSYPESSYVTALGAGTSRNEAESNAKAALSQYIRQTVVAEQRFSLNSTESTMTNQFLSDVQNYSALKDISGLDTNNSYVSPSGEYTVLAVLNRSVAGKDLKSRIAKRANSITIDYEASQSAADSFSALFAANRAAQNALLNDEDMDLLSLVHSASYATAKLSLEYPSSAELLRNAQKIAEGISVSVEAPDSALRTALCSALESYGLKIYPSGAEFVLRSSLSLSALESPNSNKFSRYTVSVSLCDSSGKEFISFEASGREGHVSQSEADYRAKKKAASVAEGQLKAKLQEMFDKTK